MPDIGEHDRRPGEEAGVYRVVGAGEGVVLLGVADAGERRVHPGELIRVAPTRFSGTHELPEIRMPGSIP